MMRFLIAILVTVGLLAMVPAGHASTSVMGGGLAAHADKFGGTSVVMVKGTQADCQRGNPCLIVCVACFPAPQQQSDDTAMTVSKSADRRTDCFADFGLSWLLYRPPKSGM